MKKLLSIVLCCVIVFALMGCAVEEKVVAVNAKNPESLAGQVFGKTALIEIGNYLYYDSTTRIVYWWNGTMYSYRCDTTPTPYYAPNGFPYLYNPETNTFEEIER